MYVISNFTVALNTIFLDGDLCNRFLKKIEKYLSPLCKVIHYCLDDNQFHLIVMMKNREAFCDFYRLKKGDESLIDQEIPFCSYIFSQQMANLQSSTAIHFNRKFKRLGALFARRFSKILIESEVELTSWVRRLNKMKKSIQQSKKWETFNLTGSRKNWLKLEKWKKERCAYFYYNHKAIKHAILSCFILVDDIDLQGQFENLPPKNIYLYKSTKPPS